ncbi:MAG TPA: SDR family oxidoreductase [Blastocatellia bacterium]|nr:SDR family oxidoreductase [Blastocatellia bacterium]HMV84180.1 SDR family oxidoreductase [Blastocatellia bacterium]HMX28828.1 SDR family oxidoreductase [Blastocatellia bacterium]HMY71109.1 SDR family oxidoreductase [Blastocatellia bacterium]HMZ19684.1 SDR family oxidoreductase [Blastocatellia bacterium]
MSELNGKSVLITGGSRGLGRALALKLAAKGAKVVLVARQKAELDEAVAEIKCNGGTAFGIVADVGDKQSIYPIAGQAAALAGPVDVLINNAGTLGPVPLRLLADTDCEDFERALQINVLGPFRLFKAVAGSMLLRQTGLVINITSDAAVEAYPGWGVYGASKAALDHLTRTATAELGGAGLRFFSVDPGEMDTQMHAEAMPEADPASLQSPETVAEGIVLMIERANEIENGARLIASTWKESL